MDDNNHGTHVSGTIGAVGNNGTGVVGVNWNTRIMGLKFLDKNGSGYISNAIDAIDWAVRARQSGVNLRVLNNSWGGGGYSQALKDVIDKAGANDILFVAAAGNNSSNNDASPSYPASYGTANEISVAATTSSDGLASFSNWGATSVDLGAPGVSILSTVRGNGYAFYNGTSMATPHVTGAAALILAACSQTVNGLKSTILNNVDPLGTLAGRVKTGGRLNVYNAIRTCSAPDFSLSVAPSSVTASPGGTATYTVTIQRTAGFSGDVSFSVSGLPAGAGALFDPSPSGGTSSTLTVTVDSSTSAGSTSFTVTGTSGALTHTASATLVVQKPDFSLGISPSSAKVGNRGGKVSYKVTITRTGGFTGAVSLSVTGLPSGASASFNPSSATGTSSTLTITVASSTVNNRYPFTVTGTSDTLVRSVSATLVKGRRW
jgi:subtilisin family serine protease